MTTSAPEEREPAPLDRRAVLGLVPASVLQGELFPEYLGVFFAVIGVVFLLVGIHGLRGTLSFRRRAQQAEGVVTDVRARSSGKSGDPGIVFYPVLQFTTRDGRQVQTEARTGRSPAPAREGDRVPVQYDPEDPASADIAGSWSGLLLYGVFVVLGSIFTVVGIVVQYAFSLF